MLAAKMNILTTAAVIAGAPPNLSYRGATFSEAPLAAVLKMVCGLLAAPGKQSRNALYASSQQQSHNLQLSPKNKAQKCLCAIKPNWMVQVQASHWTAVLANSADLEGQLG